MSATLGWGPVLHLRQEDGGCQEDEKATGVHRLEALAGDEERDAHAGPPAASEDDPAGQSAAAHPGQPLPGLEYKAMWVPITAVGVI